VGEGDRRGAVGREGRWGGGRYFAGFVLSDFVLGVFLAVFAFAVGAPGFGYVDLGAGSC
jgi:hypothetical protein